ncbi:MAG TPA: DUF2147 domain-containing protein [Gammaproteobacteria bacterium]|nr:DUF2147 domain-containing protein [Gammaproteobacteria bacterium]
MKAMSPVFKLFFTVCAAVMLFAIPAHGENSYSPVGYWQTYDEDTNQPTSILHVWENKGVLQGKVVKIFGNQSAVCSACSGSQHNQPVMGMMVMWGFTKHDNVWTNGKILAIKRGKVYNADLALTDAGQKMTVRVSVFGSKHELHWTRAQNWK